MFESNGLLGIFENLLVMGVLDKSMGWFMHWKRWFIEILTRKIAFILTPKSLQMAKNWALIWPEKTHAKIFPTSKSDRFQHFFLFQYNGFLQNE